MNNKIEIKLSKVKLLLLLLGAIMFIGIGILFIINPDEFAKGLLKNPEIVYVSGVVTIIVFGLSSIIIIIKLFSNSVGLTIDDHGITDYSSTTSVGLIEWSDIIGIETMQIASTKTLVIDIKNPQKYIKKAKNKMALGTMKRNCKSYGSPLSLISEALEIKHKALEQLLIEELEKRKN